jgi:uncharacterized UBP type Zn finger protein
MNHIADKDSLRLQKANGGRGIGVPVASLILSWKTPPSDTMNGLYDWLSSHSLGGLVNPGNRCYINSILQALLHTTPFLEIVAQHDQGLCKSNGVFCIVCSLQRLAMDMILRDGNEVTATEIFNKTAGM